MMQCKGLYCIFFLAVSLAVSGHVYADTGAGTWNDDTFSQYSDDDYVNALIASPSSFITSGDQVFRAFPDDPYNAAMVISPSPFVINEEDYPSEAGLFSGFGQGNAFTQFPTPWNFPSSSSSTGNSYPTLPPMTLQDLSNWPSTSIADNPSMTSDTLILPGGEVISPGSGGFWVSPNSPSFDALNPFKGTGFQLVRIYVQPLF